MKPTPTIALPAAATLERLFHEPSRLAVMAALSASPGGLPFTVLRDTCDLTDGNLNRHLKTLEEQGAVRLAKAFVDQKPRTTVHPTNEGLARFSSYLECLQAVLQQAQEAQRGATVTGRRHASAAHALPARANA